MTVDIQTETDIQRPRAEVAAYVADPDNATAWYKKHQGRRVEVAQTIERGIEDRLRGSVPRPRPEKRSHKHEAA
jgi:uncharacterized protein YndB with AHSA1/START domain